MVSNTRLLSAVYFKSAFSRHISKEVHIDRPSARTVLRWQIWHDAVNAFEDECHLIALTTSMPVLKCLRYLFDDVMAVAFVCLSR